jgi:hypothetical protein
VSLYRKKPVVIEARQIETYHDLEPIAAWVRSEGGKAVAGQDDTGPAYMLINTLEGTHRADIRDFVIRGVAGEFYPCKPDIFAATYELVEATDE